MAEPAVQTRMAPSDYFPEPLERMAPSDYMYDFKKHTVLFSFVDTRVEAVVPAYRACFVNTFWSIAGSLGIICFSCIPCQLLFIQ